MTEDLLPRPQASETSEACRAGLWMACLDADGRERDVDPASPAERLRRLEAFSAG